MARRTKQQESETVETFWGINPKTFEVECVSLTRGGMLRKFNADMIQSNHAVLFGRKPIHEVSIVWGLTDIISFPTIQDGSEYAKRGIAELKELAAKKKAEAQGAPKPDKEP